jgi:hypothetical protein
MNSVKLFFKTYEIFLNQNYTDVWNTVRRSRASTQEEKRERKLEGVKIRHETKYSSDNQEQLRETERSHCRVFLENSLCRMVND